MGFAMYYVLKVSATIMSGNWKKIHVTEQFQRKISDPLNCGGHLKILNKIKITQLAISGT